MRIAHDLHLFVEASGDILREQMADLLKQGLQRGPLVYVIRVPRSEAAIRERSLGLLRADDGAGDGLAPCARSPILDAEGAASKTSVVSWHPYGMEVLVVGISG